jgi:hypothetical protein
MSSHILPKRVYYTIFAILLFCTYLTVQIAFFDLGALNTVAALGIATFKAARTVSRDQVGSFIREPFVEGDGQDPVETGDLRQAIGELVTCSRCVGTWVAAGLTTTQAVAPRFGRLLTWSLAAAGVNDFLQAGFVTLTRKSE